MENGEEPNNLESENKMENPEEPSSFKPEDHKRKTMSSFDDEDDDDNNELLTLSLSSYSERMVKTRHIINQPDLEHQHGQQQDIHTHMFLPHSSPLQSPIVNLLPLHPVFAQPLPPPPQSQPQPPLRIQQEPLPAPAVPVAADQPTKDDEGDKNIIPPFPWATDRPARVHTLQYLLQNKISTIAGDVQCGSCHHKFEMRFDLRQKFRELCMFIARRKGTMHDRAPEEWIHPVLPTCEHCGVENSVKPIIGDAKEHAINWLFLLLGQLLGLCTLEHLRYFCEHTMHHRSGAKDRVLYLTYFQLIKQLKGEL